MGMDMKPKPFNRQLCDAFKVLDKDATDFVSVSELRHILTSIGEKLEVFPNNNFGADVVVGGARDEFVGRNAPVSLLDGFLGA
ncbi:putative EF-hand domain pair protein [Rosa chinensis]|uniref:Putative EF-hand domain pair protein n=1 Tax=Rosa chinensis TaxID=74649 RepID=A0A2P6R720_ROSCH|nr:putative EF-hand domain pair protein [Rosa chinensis]